MYQTVYAERLRARGLCCRCRKVKEKDREDKWMCRQCAWKHTERMKKRQSERKDLLSRSLLGQEIEDGKRSIRA